jgi:hypothetical protein
MEYLANALVDHYRPFHKHFLVPGLHLAWLTKEGPPDNNMREFALKVTAWKLREQSYAKYRERFPKFFHDFVDVNIENSHALMQKDVDMLANAVNLAFELDGCRWHTPHHPEV